MKCMANNVSFYNVLKATALPLICTINTNNILYPPLNLINTAAKIDVKVE